MNTIIAGDIPVFFPPEEEQTASLVATACSRSIPLLRERWGLTPPDDCRVFVMTSWSGFLFQAAPWPWKVALLLSMPLIFRKARATWKVAGGWTVKFGRRSVVGVKPARLLLAGDRRIGDRFFTREIDTGDMVQAITCHELVHAFMQHLRLPIWLNEGLATLAMEVFLNRSLVRIETLENLRISLPETGNAKQLRVDREEEVIREFSRGYWRVRYIDCTRPNLLKSLLSERILPEQLKKLLASEYGMAQDNFWIDIDKKVIDRYAPY